MEGLQISFKTDMNREEGRDAESFLYGDKLFIVADGLCSEDIREVVAKWSCQLVYDSFFRYLSEGQSPSMALTSALYEANKVILDERKKTGREMAASVGVVYIKENIMYFTHLGDSRIYCLHAKELNQLTRDHTLLEEKPFVKAIYRDPALMYAITEGLGIHEKPSIKVKKYPLRRKDLIILTTEGLTKRISNKEILRLSLKIKNTKTLCKSLIDLSERKGGKGNITVGIIRFGKRPLMLRNLKITYSVFLLLLLLAAGGFSLKYIRMESHHGQVEESQPVQENSSLQVETDSYNPVNRSKETVDRLEKPIQGMAEKKSDAALNDKIQALMKAWKIAWENTAGEKGEMEGYMSFYSDDFATKELDKKGWRGDKEEKGRAKSWIRLELIDLDISKTTENRLEVRFLQDYKSSNFSEKSQKKLILIKKDSEWKILSEETY